MKINYRLYILYTLINLSALSSQFAYGETFNMSISSLVEEALTNNPEINYYVSEIDATQSEYINSGKLQNPELSVNAGRKESSDSGKNTGQGLAFTLAFSQTFEYPGRIKLREAIALHQTTIAKLELEKFRQALTAKVKILSYQLYQSQEVKKAAEVVLKRGKDLVGIMSKRELPGINLQLEQQIINSSILTLSQKAVGISSETERLVLEINQLCGKPNRGSFSVQIPNFKVIPLIPNQEALLQMALERNLEISLKSKGLDQQSLKVKLSENEQNPSFTVGPYISDERSEDLERVIGIGVSVPLPLWNDNSANIATQKAKQSQYQALYQSARNEIEKEIRARSNSFQLKVAEIARLRPDVVENLRNAAKTAEEHYQLGAVPVTTYLQLQQQYVDGLEAILKTKISALEDLTELESLTGDNFTSQITEHKKT